jgi:hypothetical protein
LTDHEKMPYTKMLMVILNPLHNLTWYESMLD